MSKPISGRMAASPVAAAARAAWRPQDLRTSWEWCEGHIVVDKMSPMPGPWRVANSPWVKELMECKADRGVTFLAVRCSAQSSKTQTVLNLVCYDIAEDPGPSMYVLANNDDAADFVRDRFEPTMRFCKPVADMLVRHAKNAFKFRTMPLYFVGAGSMGKLQGKPMRRLYLDEARNYPDGALETVLKRVRAWGDMAQVFLISTPGMKDDAIDRAFMQGDQRTYHLDCPCCGRVQRLHWDQLKWDTNETTRPNGVYNFDALAETIRYECENRECGQKWRDVPIDRKWICRNGKFIRLNPGAPKHHVSFTWSALLPWWVKWRSLVEEFIYARAAVRAGDVAPMKTFITESLGEPFEDRLGVIEDFKFLELRKSPYEYGEVWPEAKRRFMAADKQEKGGEHYPWVIREFALAGKSRLVAHGIAMTLEELEQIRKDNNVAPGNAMIDSGYEAQKVYRFAATMKWRVFKGDSQQFYLVSRIDPANPNLTVTVRQLWRITKAVVYNEQTRRRVGEIPLYTFCDDATKDFLFEFLNGLVGQWTVPDLVAADYLRQIASERREMEEDKTGHVHYFWRRTGPNHFLDCEKMILVAAIITKLIASPAQVVKREPRNLTG